MILLSLILNTTSTHWNFDFRKAFASVILIFLILKWPFPRGCWAVGFCIVSTDCLWEDPRAQEVDDGGQPVGHPQGDAHVLVVVNAPVVRALLDLRLNFQGRLTWWWVQWDLPTRPTSRQSNWTQSRQCSSFVSWWPGSHCSPWLKV